MDSPLLLQVLLERAVGRGALHPRAAQGAKALQPFSSVSDLPPPPNGRATKEMGLLEFPTAGWEEEGAVHPCWNPCRQGRVDGVAASLWCGVWVEEAQGGARNQRDGVQGRADRVAASLWCGVWVRITSDCC